MDTAGELARAWPDAELLLDNHSEHQGSDVKREWLAGALDMFARQ
ncbi:MAG TPA: hypothetical protein VK162_13755 [Streptosporangiaceae bacterium]|nr:hypothetical protein [Streptosporangiaceae bacterium]